jgi:hypothetical protein
VAIKTPPRPTSMHDVEVRPDTRAPLGHEEAPLVTRGRTMWAIAMLTVLVAALVVGILLRPTSTTWAGDWKDLVVEPAATVEPTTPTAPTGDWKDLVEPAPSADTGDWKDLVEPAPSADTGDWKDLVEPAPSADTGDWKDTIG